LQVGERVRVGHGVFWATDAGLVKTARAKAAAGPFGLRGACPRFRFAATGHPYAKGFPTAEPKRRLAGAVQMAARVPVLRMHS
jgi:hypothetical protein